MPSEPHQLGWASRKKMTPAQVCGTFRLRKRVLEGARLINLMLVIVERGRDNRAPCRQQLLPLSGVQQSEPPAETTRSMGLRHAFICSIASMICPQRCSPSACQHRMQT